MKAYADPKLRDEIPEVNYSASVVTDEEVAQIMQQGIKHSAEHVAAQVAMGDALIQDSRKSRRWELFNSADRTVAMDLLGFKKQLVSQPIRWHCRSSQLRNQCSYATVRPVRTTGTWRVLLPKMIASWALALCP